MKNRYLPFGYKIADGKIVADSEQVEAVRRIFDAYTAGQTFQQMLWTYVSIVNATE